ncbi:LysR substrate-binding domain-containing protein [Roseococcus suduntuyensis]|uniref:LysR family glycine cleavage system transcriptional activator n=1 Tax=Roseococcus suduntuyensis TaxID=455361 RepID=A0A840A7Z8_9PROT|nr:LysR substrate-binding domain-containing protein [Roseococcus suduntuyensis]MBB3896656.1 LysR family glycine cleavage system transcriptional activator [Roseococcus suduntuyensis]
MHRHTPPTHWLRAFEACARHLSVSRAAEELSLTQSAVSRQLAALEGQLGLRLFQRVRQRLVLTAAAASYAPEVRAALARIDSATQEVLAHRGAGGTLNLVVSPTFGARWLMPRMPRFQARHRLVVVNIRNHTTLPRPLDFAGEGVHAAIYMGAVPRAGVTLHPLVRDVRVPICAPALLAGGGLPAPAALVRHTLLQQTTRPRAWLHWLQAHGVTGVDGLRGPQYQHHAMVAEAAAAGLGVALMPRFLVEPELAAGRLVVPFDLPLDDGEAYSLAYPQEAAGHPVLRAFRDWLLAEVAEVAEASG